MVFLLQAYTVRVMEIISLRFYFYFYYYNATDFKADHTCDVFFLLHSRDTLRVGAAFKSL